MKILLRYSFMALALALGASAAAHADPPWWHNGPQHPQAAPEIDPSLAVSGIALVGGTLTVARARRRK